MTTLTFGPQRIIDNGARTGTRTGAHVSARQKVESILIDFTANIRSYADGASLADFDVNAVRTLMTLISTLQVAGMFPEAAAIVALERVFAEQCPDWPDIEVEALALWDDICRELGVSHRKVMGLPDWSLLQQWRETQVEVEGSAP